MREQTFDVECYPNFFLVLFQDEEGGLTRFQISPNRRLDRDALLRVLERNVLIGFNSTEYDLPMIQLALKGYSVGCLKEASDEIIGGMRSRDFADKHKIMRPSWDHIDLIAVAPLKGSLKTYAARLHTRHMHELPYDPDLDLTAAEAEVVARYCGNDLANTWLLRRELAGQISLRESLSSQYNCDLRSKSDPQVAERVISEEVARINKCKPFRPEGLEGTSYKYKIPSFISFRSKACQGLLEKIRNARFVVGDNGSVTLPKEIEGMEIRIGGGKYRVGIGGLHSSETKVTHYAGEKYLLIDRDVTSYYPSIILNQGLFPEHLGPAFLQVYRSLVERRVEAKRAGDKVTAESLKIAVNGSFGKLGSKWSVLYAPDLLIQVTITGQLSLLMLIEMLESQGVPVLSANTDGILLKVHKDMYSRVEEIIAEWEKLTGFFTEETRYVSVHSKDVNNYIALKKDGSVKAKGLYANPWEKPGPNIFKMHKNPTTTIVIEAVVEYLKTGRPLRQTIEGSKDVTKFVAVRAVKGGAMTGKTPTDAGDKVGKVIRWYYSREARGSIMSYAKNGNKVPKSDGTKPLMDLPDEFPSDINYDWYVREAMSVLDNVGCGEQIALFPAA